MKIKPRWSQTLFLQSYWLFGCIYCWDEELTTNILFCSMGIKFSYILWNKNWYLSLILITILKFLEINKFLWKSTKIKN